MAERLRAPIQYYGGKGNLLGKLLPLIPVGGKPYIEPYLGGGSVFFAREPAPVEVLNDLDGDIVTLMRALQDRTTFEELRHRLTWTPYARDEFARALEILARPDADPVDRAWAKFVASNQGMSGVHQTAGNWSRTFTSAQGCAANTSSWLMRLSMLDAWRVRLMRAQIDHRDALEVIRYWDCDEAIIYCDPPYVLDTRNGRTAYRHEACDDHHAMLVQTLLACSGAVILSGYDHTIYQPLIDAGWDVIRIDTACHAAGRVRGSRLRGFGAALQHAARTECVWRNPKAVHLAGGAQLSLLAC